MRNYYAQPVPAPCRYTTHGYCTAHVGGTLYAPGVPWCGIGRRVVLAVARVYAQQAKATPGRPLGVLGRHLWRAQQAQLRQAAHQLHRRAGP